MRALALVFAVSWTVVLAGCTTGAVDSVAPTATSTTLTTASPTPTSMMPGADPILGVVPPVPTDQPFIEYSYRYRQYVAECSAAAGFEWKIIGGAAPHLSFVGTNTPRRVEVHTRCAEIAHERGWVIPDPFDGSIAANATLYDIYIDIYECLVEHGYPTTQPPSGEAFVEEGDSIWTPWDEMYSSVFYVDPDLLDQLPPGDRLQYEAQETCGGAPQEIYDARLQEQG